MSRIDAFCSKPPYIEHAAPVWKALPEEVRGRFSVTRDLEDLARRHGIETTAYENDPDRAVMILSRCDAPNVRGRDIVFLEHGAGATYSRQSHLKNVRQIGLILTTPANEEAHRAKYGDIVKVIGSPKMDAFSRITKPRSDPPVIAVSHHWDQKSVPETTSAWPWDKAAWERVFASGRYTCLGHKHPGDKRDLESWYVQNGIEFVADFREVLERADLYCADNTSTLYEFAATGRPVLVLSPPRYRRNVDFGIRFWHHIPGVECSVLEHLEACIEEALADLPERRRLREAAVEAVYGTLDGKATERAVREIVRYLRGRTT